jgi:hypothetical protein
MAINVTRATHVCGLVRTWRCDGGCYEGDCREQRARPCGDGGAAVTERSVAEPGSARRPA